MTHSPNCSWTVRQDSIHRGTRRELGQKVGFGLHSTSTLCGVCAKAGARMLCEGAWVKRLSSPSVSITRDRCGIRKKIFELVDGLVYRKHKSHIQEKPYWTLLLMRYSHSVSTKSTQRVRLFEVGHSQALLKLWWVLIGFPHAFVWCFCKMKVGSMFSYASHHLFSWAKRRDWWYELSSKASIGSSSSAAGASSRSWSRLSGSISSKKSSGGVCSPADELESKAPPWPWRFVLGCASEVERVACVVKNASARLLTSAQSRCCRSKYCCCRGVRALIFLVADWNDGICLLEGILVEVDFCATWGWPLVCPLRDQRSVKQVKFNWSLCDSACIKENLIILYPTPKGKVFNSNLWKRCERVPACILLCIDWWNLSPSTFAASHFCCLSWATDVGA